MEAIITIIFALSILQFSLQLTVIQNKNISWIWLTLLSIAIYLAYPYAIEQSYLRFQQTINNLVVMNDFILILIIESILGIIMSVFMIRYIYNEPIKKGLRYLNYIPGIIVFPAIFYFESYCFLSIHVFTFTQLAIIIALFMPLFIYGMKRVLKWVIPEIDLQYEFKFFLHIINLVLGIILSILLFKTPIQSSIITYDIIQLIVIGFIIVFFAGIGFIKYQKEIKKFL